MKLDPRVAIFYLITVIFLIFIETRINWLMFITLVFFFFYLHQASYQKVGQIAFLLLIPSILIVVLNALFVSQDAIFISIMLIRFWGLAWLFNWFLIIVDPDLLTQALIAFKIPYKYAWQVSLAYRFLPMFQEESQQLYNAQVSRGVPLDRGFFTRLRFISSLIIPLLVMSQDKSNRFAEALLARDWDPDSPNTFIFPLKMQFIDFFFFITLICISIIIIFL